MLYRIVYNGGFSGAGPFHSGESKVLQLTGDKIRNNIAKLRTCICLMDNYKVVKR